MKAKATAHMKAIKLRKQGLSYREIMKRVPVSQASLSVWLRHLPLPVQRSLELQRAGQALGARIRHQDRINKLCMLTEEVKIELPALCREPFFCLGLALYWGEGTKEKPWRITTQCRFSNSDPNMILIMREWFIKYANLSLKDFYYRLFIHEKTASYKALQDWAAILGESKEVIAVSLKKHDTRGRHHNCNYKGLIQMTVRRSAWINRRIDLWIKGATQCFLKPTT